MTISSPKMKFLFKYPSIIIKLTVADYVAQAGQLGWVDLVLMKHSMEISVFLLLWGY